jgi:SAM-dependent methyltransferase
MQQIKKFLKKFLPGFVQIPLKRVNTVLNRLIEPPLESFPHAPEIFGFYRYLARHPELTRKPGGWEYKDRFYPDYMTVGGASQAIFREAKKYCQGKGVDVGAGFWPLPGATPVDPFRGPGMTQAIEDIESHSLDYVFSSHCLEHIENWKDALKLWGDRVKIGGVFFLYLPHPISGIWQPGSPMVADGHKWSPDPNVIQVALRELGFEIVSFDPGPDAMDSFYVCARKSGS